MAGMSQSLIDRLREHIKGHKSTEAEFCQVEPSRPTTPAVVAEAESSLGFPLPSLLRDAYTMVGNGGFGPGYGLMDCREGRRSWEIPSWISILNSGSIMAPRGSTGSNALCHLRALCLSERNQWESFWQLA
jgi:hypothetical protein